MIPQLQLQPKTQFSYRAKQTGEMPGNRVSVGFCGARETNLWVFIVFHFLVFSQEAKSLVSQRSFNPKDIFTQREQSFKASSILPPASSRPGKRQPILEETAASDGGPSLSFHPPGKLQSPFLSQKSFEREVPPKSQSPPAPIVLPTSSVKAPSPVSPVPAPAAVSFTHPEPVQPAGQNPSLIRHEGWKVWSPWNADGTSTREPKQ